MTKIEESMPPKGGFSFDLCKRNDMLVQKGLKQPSFLKTGTTIVGLVFQVHSSLLLIFWNKVLLLLDLIDLLV